MKTFYCVFSLAVIFAEIHVEGKENSVHLHKYLLDPSRYDKRVRPAENTQEAVNVTFGIVLQEIMNLNDKSQLLITKVAIIQSWVDKSLSWNKTAFGGVEQISIHPELIWIPDIVLYNNAGEGFGEGTTRTDAVIRYDGLVSMNIPSILKSSCKIYVANYPFDEQSCNLKFGSWTYDGSQIALHIESSSADLSEYVLSMEWELITAPGKFHSIIYMCCINPYHDITYTIKINRRSLFYAMYLIIPCVMIAVLTLLVFLLPPDCSERMTVGMAILVGLSFFFLLVAENMPATSEAVPLIGMYYTVTMLEVSCAFFMTCWVLRFHHHNPTEGGVPDWIKVYLLGHAARYLRFDFSEEKKLEEAREISETLKSSADSLNDDDQRTLVKFTPVSDISNSSPVDDSKKDANAILGENIRQQEILEERQEEWRRAALVLNSIFMWIFVVALVITFAAICLYPLVTD